jgi:uncharacterized protein
MRSLDTIQFRDNIPATSAEADVLHQVRSTAQKHFSAARGSHDWEHTLRVHRLCRKIGPKENADMLVVEAAAYLHDIGRSLQDNSCGDICHAEKGAEIAAGLLADLTIANERKVNIVESIRTHRFRNHHRPATIEAQVLFDADKLDAIGAVGVARAYLFAGELGACLHNPNIAVEEARPYSKNDTGYREYQVKLSKVVHRMLTNEGKRLAQQRNAFMVTFFKRFLDEYEGKC